MKTTTRTRWQRVRWPFDKATADEWEAKGIRVFMLKIYKGKVFLIDNKHKHYTVSCGADSDRSHSGCFYPENPSLAQAMQQLEAKDFS